MLSASVANNPPHGSFDRTNDRASEGNTLGGVKDPADRHLVEQKLDHHREDQRKGVARAEALSRADRIEHKGGEADGGCELGRVEHRSDRIVAPDDVRDHDGEAHQGDEQEPRERPDRRDEHDLEQVHGLGLVTEGPADGRHRTQREQAEEHQSDQPLARGRWPVSDEGHHGKRSCTRREYRDAGDYGACLQRVSVRPLQWSSVPGANR